MITEWLQVVWEHYNLLAAAIALAGIVAISIIGKKIYQYLRMND